MIELIFAKSLQALIPQLQIANIYLPEWNIQYDDTTVSGTVLTLPLIMQVGVQALADRIIEDGIETVEYYGYAQHMDNFLKSSVEMDGLFPLGNQTGFESHQLVINIRGNEILDGHHPGYVLLPLAFYESIIDNTGLEPVFFGQLTDSPYMDALKSRFPAAQLVKSKGAMQDFDILRKSRNIIPAVSTFSWLASWLSSATVHFPVVGLFSPFQEKDHMLIPLSETRYRFYQFPISYSVPVDYFAAAHAIIENRWEAISAQRLRWQLFDQSAQKANYVDYLYAFDPLYYRNRWVDIERMFGDDRNLARRHYIDHGYCEKRSGFDFNERLYFQNHPDAACSVGRGEYTSAIDHYLLVGRRCGYRPT